MTEFNCRTKDVTQLNEQIHRIRIVPEDHRLFDFKGGQYIILHMPDGKKVPLSIASAPEERSFLELHVRLVDGHSLAQEMINLFEGTAEYTLEGAYGGCYLNDSTRNLVIIAGGTGFSPMKSMIESAFAQKVERQIELYLGAQVTDDLYQHDLIIQWEKDNGNFSYTPVVSGDDDSWQGATGFPHESAMNCSDKELIEKDYYISGSEPMVMAVYNALREKGVNKSQIHSDMLNIKREKGEID
ncbi:MAG: NAD(P)H-flavin reductase [Kangiellaceae bacterium]|nr:NAD(P)H-flavin reductase [Kangiellaceae bacterium]